MLSEEIGLESAIARVQAELRGAYQLHRGGRIFCVLLCCGRTGLHSGESDRVIKVVERAPSYSRSYITVIMHTAL